MIKAFRAVKNGMPVRTAARTYNVPRSTLLARTSGHVSMDCLHPGLESLLSLSEEKELLSHINQMADAGHGYTGTDVRLIGRELAISLGKSVKSKEMFNRAWLLRFQRKWHDVRISKVRKTSPTEEMLLNYFQELGILMATNDLNDHPDRIFTVTETKLDGGKEHAYNETKHEASWTVTLIASGNALGNQVPPYYVFPGEEWDDELLQDAYTGTDGEMTEDGCSNSGVLLNYLTNHFANYIPLSQGTDGHKTLILLDDNNHHHIPILKKWADKNNVLLFPLPPLSNYLTEQISVIFHEMFKTSYGLEHKLNVGHNSDFLITIKNIAKFTARPYADTMSSENLSLAFRKAGIYPIDNSVINLWQ